MRTAFNLNIALLILIPLGLLLAFAPRLAGAPQTAATQAFDAGQDSLRTQEAMRDSLMQAATVDSMKTDSTRSDSAQLKLPTIMKPAIRLRSVSELHVDTTWQVDRQAFSAYLAEDVGDLMRHLPGVYVHDPVSAGQPEFAGYHGGRPNALPILLNGCLLAYAESGSFDLSRLPVESIECIRLLRDPADALQADGALALTTRTFEGGNRPISYVSYHKGGNGYSAVDVLFGQKITQHADVNAGVTYRNFGGDFPHSAYEAQQIRNQVRTLLTPNWFMDYAIIYDKSDADVPGFVLADGQASTPEAHAKTVFYAHALNLHGNVFADSTEDVRLRFYYVSNYREFRDRPHALDETNRYGSGGTQLETTFPLWRGISTLGSEVQARFLHSAEMGRRVQPEFSVYAREAVAITASLQLKIAGKLQLHKQLGAFFSPRASIEIGKAGSKAVCSGSYARSLPAFFQLYRNNPYQAGFSGLRAEKIKALDVVYSRRVSGTITVKSGGFIKVVVDPIYEIATDSIRSTFTNGHAATFMGIDLQTDWQPNQRLAVGVLANAILGRNLLKGHLQDQPAFYGDVHFDVFHNFFENDLKTHSRLSLKMVGDRWCDTIDSELPPYHFTGQMIKLTPDPLFNIKLIGAVRDVQFFVSIENILGRKYQLTYGIPGRGRTLHWGLTWKFLD